MPKTSDFFLLCSLLAVPLLGSSSAHAALIVNNETSKCLDVKFDNTANGTPLRSVPCSAMFGQQWKWQGLEIRGIGTSDGVGKCVDVFHSGTADGTLVQLFDCNGTGAQKWRFDSGQIINVPSGKCLDPGDGSNSTQATIRTCTPGVVGVQRWTLRSVQFINVRGRGFESDNSGKCLNVMGERTAAFTPIQSAQCDATFAQAFNWEFFGIQAIGTNRSGSRCVDVVGGTADQTPVQLFPCNGTAAQQWVFANGQIVNPQSGKCLDVFDDPGVTQARIRTCGAIDPVGQRWVIR